jgi:hypothetical protein
MPGVFAGSVPPRDRPSEPGARLAAQTRQAAILRAKREIRG